MPRTAIKQKSLTTADRVQLLVDLDKKISDLNAKHNALIKDLKSEYDELAAALMDELESSGTELMRTPSGTVSIIKSDVAKVEDWDKVHAWIRKNNAFHLLMRKINNAPYRELMQLRKNRAIPGLATVEVKKLSLTNKKK